MTSRNIYLCAVSRTATMAVACVAFLSFWALGPAGASAPTPNFAGQRITIINGSPAGGGYDAYARLVARHLGSWLPGSPAIVVQEMPGAGSLIAANWLANSAPKNGTAIAILPNATIFEPLFGNRNAHFDPRSMNWLASLNDFTPVAAVWSNTPFTTAQDLFNHDVLVGASGATSDNSVWPNLLNALIHTRFKVVNGYPGTAGIVLALERGEIQGIVGSDWDSIKATQPGWLRDKKIRILVQETLTRHSELSEVPTALELADAESRDVLSLLIARERYGRPFLAPPDVPEAILTVLREGFKKMLDDVEFIHDAEQANLTIHAVNGGEISATLSKLFASPQSVIDQATAELRRLDPP